MDCASKDETHAAFRRTSRTFRAKSAFRKGLLSKSAACSSSPQRTIALLGYRALELIDNCNHLQQSIWSRVALTERQMNDRGAMTTPSIDAGGERHTTVRWSVDATFVLILASCTALWAALASLLIFI